MLFRSNRLLKILEEPPTGYIFLHSCQNITALLPTIRSRSVIVFEKQVNHESSRILSFLLDKNNYHNYQIFERYLKEDDPSPHESYVIAQELFILHKDKLSEKAHQKLTEYLQHPPMAGGAKIYLRQILLGLSL